MHAYGVRFAFGIPGNDVLELIRACEQTGIKFVLAKSEPSAGFMADAIAQLTGDPAVCIFALGPGVVNGATGVATSLMERTPVIILGGEMASNRRGLYTHQVFDHVALMNPITKLAAELNPDRAAQQVAKALDVAMTEPRGAVYLNCPADASRADAVETGPRFPATQHFGIADQAAIQSAQDRLSKAKQPLALIGLTALRNGVPNKLKDFLEAWQIPFLTTFKAKGVVSERHDLSLGALGLSPIADDVTQKLVQEADHLTLIGFDAIELRDAWLDAWGSDKPCLTLDWAPQSDRVFPSGDQILGDLGTNIAELSAAASPATAWPESRIKAYREALQKIVAPRKPETGVSPAALFAEIDAHLDDRTVLTADVGAHRILACHAFRCILPNQLLQTNGLCSMGYAIPAAVGAALAEPNKRIVALVGDGSTLMSLGELAVVAEHRLSVTVIVLNDASLALIELKQSKLQVETNAVRFKSPNFCDVAKGFGYKAMRVGTNDEFKAAYERSRGMDGPVLIEAVCDASEYWDQM
ncbi:MAG: thiamine pyrophosphate-binding protein [Hyphomicrobiaceae bacterium]|nr:thiamine pyrophosphate-binding protein [Hyphomicrobiaceae bacterium]